MFLALPLPLSIACGQGAFPASSPRLAGAGAGAGAGASVPSPDAAASTSAAPMTWPALFAVAMQGRGEPHAQPIPLPRDARGRDRWLLFVGTSDVAVGAWRASRDSGGDVQIEAIERWPVGVRVLGGVVDGGAAYVLLESVAVLDQPAGLRGVWIDSGPRATPFDASPLALADVRDVAELASRVAHPPPTASSERTAVALLASLRAASGSTALLARTLAAEGVDVGTAWQSTFVQHVGTLAAEGAAPNPLADRVLSIVRAALSTQACGGDSCEGWTDTGHAILRFVVQGDRWVLRSAIEDAAVVRVSPGATPHEVAVSTDSAATESLLRSRARQVSRVLGEAPLTATGGTIGVGTTDLSLDVPVVAVREGLAARVFAIDVGTVRAEASEAQWDAAFGDIDGDGRTDVVVRMSGKRADGSPVAWAQAFLAPAASVQVTSLEPDLASSLAAMDAPDARAAAHAATSLPGGGVAKDDACRVLSLGSTAAGFRKVATPDARVLLFDEPGMPTWRPKIVASSKVVTDQVRSLGAHCAELACSPTRPYCSYTSGADSLHAWFAWQGGQLAIVGAADYQGE